MTKEKKCYYLSVPDKVNWMEIKILESKVVSEQNWDDCFTVSEGDTFALSGLKRLVADLKDAISAYHELIRSDFGTPSTSQKVWWVNVSEASKVLKIGLGSTTNSNPSNCYYFQDKNQANGLRTVIRTIFMKYGIKTEEFDN